MEIGRNSAFKLSGNSVRPAYPGFIVMNVAQDITNLIILPSNMKLGNGKRVSISRRMCKGTRDLLNSSNKFGVSDCD